MLLEEFIKPLGLRQTDAAGQLGISLNRLNEVVRGRRRITADTAIRLSVLLQTSPQFWMRLQADWDLHQAIAARGGTRRRTESGEAPGWQGATNEHIGNM